MPQTALFSEPMRRAAHRLAPGVGYLGLAAGVMLVLAAVLPRMAGVETTIVALAIAATLAALAATIRWLSRRHTDALETATDQIAAFVALDASPSFTVDTDGEIGYLNRAALQRFGSREGQSIVRVLGEVLANPGALIERMHNRAAALGASREDMVTRRGHVRIGVHRIGEGRYLWRLEDMAERAVGGRGAETISLPMLTASKSGTVLFMNEALRRMVGERVKSLDRMFPELPVRSGEVMRISTTTGSVDARVVEVEGTGGRREFFILPVPSSELPTIAPAADTFEALPVALMKLDAKGVVISLNREARSLVGDITSGTKMPDLFEGLGRSVRDWLSDAVAGRSDGKPEVLRRAIGESEVYLQVSLSRASGSEGEALIAVLSDATQLKTLEAQFVQSQKMQAIGQLAGGVAHDFNNLLTAISGHCDLLLLRHDKDHSDYADLIQINQNANRAASLVGQLLAFSRKQTLTPKIIDLKDSLSEMTHLLNRLVGEKVKLYLRHDADLRPIRADRRQLEQVLMNLVVNSRDAMPSGGTIRINSSNEVLLETLVRDRATVPVGQYVVVRVIDEGVGIPSDKLTKIFEPFYTTKRTGEGTGLGLSTAYGIVKQSGGYIFCDSVLGSGTTFSIYFPAHEQSALAEEVPAAPVIGRRSGAIGGGVVLLVEDEAPVRAFASRALRLRGYTVIEAQSAEEALRILDDPEFSVDVFVTDVIMPGMDGPSWVREALKARPGTRVVFVSGYAEDNFGESQREIPNAIFLPKPFSLGELTATVQQQLH